ncbi:MAG TPA: type IIL restriction-modification enzyme MmeI [Microvirga sp.]|jgi:hypothetical protein
MGPPPSESPEVGQQVEAFIGRWGGREGGAERANFHSFLRELCDVIGVGKPEPAAAEPSHNDYVFERAVRRRDSDPSHHPRYIDLYKRRCFIMEAKQSRRCCTRSPAMAM